MIQMFHVSKAYQNDSPVLVDITMHVEKGAFVFLTGPSGAGKTTLLKLLFCETPPTSGQVLIMGRNVSRINDGSIPFLRRKIGVVFQDFRLLPTRSVFENVAVALEVIGRPRRDIDRAVQVMLKRVGLSHRARAFPEQLSGGEQQRAAIARALINDPVILLADEPTGNLDDATTRDIITLFNDANARGTTIVLATHDTRLFESTGRRVIRLEGGRALSDSELKLSPDFIARMETEP
jgi:cell division transport system ATP-binding protein